MIDIKVLKQEEQELTVPLIENNFSSNKIKNVTYNNHAFAIGAFDNEKLVGHAFVHEILDYLNNETSYIIEYVVVDCLYRNQKIATNMFHFIEDLAKNKGISTLILTSNAERVEARNFYKKYGFECKDTGIFRKNVKEK